jgi:hypothetical protein
MTRTQIRVRILLCAALGLITTVAVAWGLAFWVDIGSATVVSTWVAEDRLASMVAWGVHRRDAFGSSRLVAMPRVTRNSPRVIAPAAPAGPVALSAAAPWWSRMQSMIDHNVHGAKARVLANQGHGYASVLCEDARGWPLPALRCVWDFGERHINDQTTLRGGFELGSSAASRPGTISTEKLRALPYMPVWTGFAVDWILFTVIFAALLIPPRAIRRTIRQRRGWCIHCGYDLRGGARERCPECGASVATGPGAAAGRAGEGQAR